MASFSVILPIDPPTVTHHRKKIVRFCKRGAAKPRLGLADTAQLEHAREAIALTLAQSGKRPRRPLTGPLAVSYEFYFQGEAPGFHAEKPDDDNLQKTLQDVLVDAGWIEDDRMICRKAVSKDYTDLAPRIEICAFELQPTELEMRVIFPSREWTLGSWVP